MEVGDMFTRIFVLASVLLPWSAGVAMGAGNDVTFYKDVLPILQKNCQTCHRPGQIAPMALTSYKETRPWAKAMKAAVLARKMPPWFADPQYGHFANDRSLKQSEIETLVKWGDGGVQEGEGKDGTAVVRWPDGGGLINPDAIVDRHAF